MLKKIEGEKILQKSPTTSSQIFYGEFDFHMKKSSHMAVFFCKELMRSEKYAIPLLDSYFSNRSSEQWIWMICDLWEEPIRKLLWKYPIITSKDWVDWFILKNKSIFEVYPDHGLVVTLLRIHKNTTIWHCLLSTEQNGYEWE